MWNSNFILPRWNTINTAPSGCPKILARSVHFSYYSGLSNNYGTLCCLPQCYSELNLDQNTHRFSDDNAEFQHIFGSLNLLKMYPHKLLNYRHVRLRFLSSKWTRYYHVIWLHVYDYYLLSFISFIIFSSFN